MLEPFSAADCGGGMQRQPGLPATGRPLAASVHDSFGCGKRCCICAPCQTRCTWLTILLSAVQLPLVATSKPSLLPLRVSNVYQQFSDPEEGSVQNIIDFSIWPLLQVLNSVLTLCHDRSASATSPLHRHSPPSAPHDITICRKAMVRGHV